MPDPLDAPPLRIEAGSDTPRLVAPACLFLGLAGWVFAGTPLGAEVLGHERGRSLTEMALEETVYALFLGVSLLLVLLGTILIALVPSMGRRPRTDPDWRAFYRDRNRAAGLMLLSGVPLILAGTVTLVIQVLSRAGLIGTAAGPWTTQDALGLGMSVLFVLIGLLTMWKSWTLMQLVPWERQADEPLPFDAGGEPDPAASVEPGP